jgi:hypothetical protein
LWPRISIWQSNFRESTTAKSILSIGWLWGRRHQVQLGDKIGGFKAQETVETLTDVIHWRSLAVDGGILGACF